MARHLDLSEGRRILELGGGTGAITDALLRGGVDPGQLVVLEQSDRFVSHLRHRFPRVRVVRGDARYAKELLHRMGPFDAVISGLPLHALDATTVASITKSCVDVLTPHGKLLQFTYALPARSPWLREQLRRVASQTVLLNIPPARVDVFEHQPVT